ncbi:MAG: aspartate kinase [Myxococcales bacterium]|nr:aspartate kinase [Myxococcales bacterium]
MSLIVQKFGGSSMASAERIQLVARRALATHRAGHRVVVVVSAMAGETDRLLQLASQLTKKPHDREIDVLLATGEQVSIALLALALQEQGADARSFLGHQVRIETDSSHGQARIQTIDAEPVQEALADGAIVVVAGFQGVDAAGNITTLGRGGSDLSAVALAAAVQADACEIYSDVDGIYTTDPNVYAKARRIDVISCEEMLELASLGAKVLQARSVEFALKYRVRIHCLSTFVDGPGSWVVPDADPQEAAMQSGMEGAVVIGIAHDRNTAWLTVHGVPDQPGKAAALFRALANDHINVDVIIQNPAIHGRTDVCFTVAGNVADRAVELMNAQHDAIGFTTLDCNKGVAKVSVVGAGMRSQPGVALRMFQALGDAGINILLISTSEIKISVVIDDRYTELAVRVLHDAFELEKVPGGTALA